MRNYFNYFTEIEERFQRRRGTLTMLSTLDWALIETWRDAGVPLAAVLRGIDEAFDKHDARVAKDAGRVRKVNGLAWAAQSVMTATEQMREAAVGASALASSGSGERESGFEAEPVAAYLERNAERLSNAEPPPPADALVAAIAEKLRELAGTVLDAKRGGGRGGTGTAAATSASAAATEHVEQALTVLEEKLLAALMLVTPDEELVRWREEAARGLASNRGGMSPAQVKQVTQQFLNKRVLEASGMPRLSLFYMDHR